MKNLKKILLSVFILGLIFSNIILSQKLPLERPFNLVMDFARFKKDVNNSYLELYYSYSNSNLTKIDNGQATELIIHFIIKDLNMNQIAVDRMWNLRNEIHDSTELKSNTRVGQSRFILGPGNYLLSVYGSDRHNRKNIDSVKFEFKITPYDDSKIFLSDLELCSSIKSVEKDTQNMFYKNNYEIKPNPLALIPAEYPLLGYYLEGYNIRPQFIGNNLYTEYKIIDSYGKEYLSKLFTKKIIKETSVESGIINLKNLPGGSYILVFSILDSTNKTVVKKEKKFFIYNPSKNIKPPVVDKMIANDFSYLNDEELNKLFVQAKYLASKQELDIFNRMKTSDEKRNFLTDFWKKREESEVTFKIYSARIKFANERFRTKFEEGWRSDRGRICLEFGIPEETFIQRGEIEEQGRPYEIWYHPAVRNGVYFVFSDESGFSNYRLVHSTHPNEVHDSTWDDIIKTR